MAARLPSEFVNIRVTDGIAWLTVEGEFMVGVTLRMRPQSPQGPLISDSERVTWFLMEVKFFLAAERPHGDIEHIERVEQGEGCVVSADQVEQLVQYLRHTMFHSKDALGVLFHKLHSLCLALQLDILHSQTAQLQPLREEGLVVTHSRHQHLTLSYWPNAPVIQGLPTAHPCPSQHVPGVPPGPAPNYLTVFPLHPCWHLP